jgi:pimeloyl-ACP methyl ester carboxylesterase
MTDFHPVWYNSSDHLRLFAREYRRAESPFTLLCMHGLTRNSADFEAFCDVLAGHYHILVPDQRGRGYSEYDPEPARYQIATYVEDMFQLLREKRVERVVPIGTSMGGIIAMQMLAERPAAIRGLILNDVGAEVEARGLNRIQQYVGRETPPGNWSEAAEQTRRINEIALPDYTDEDWQRLARKYYHEDSDGKPVRNYDPRIAPAGDDPGPASAMDLWPLFDSLPDVPMLVIRGEHSDILSRKCLADMAARRSDLQTAEIPNRGHAPMLDEPEALAAIRRFLDALTLIQPGNY